MFRKPLILLSVFAMVVPFPALAFDFLGERTIKLAEVGGEQHAMGTISFSKTNGQTTYTIDWNDQSFAEHFLSMRPFKCFEGSSKHWCRVPYPYDIKRTVSAADLTDLEYDLLFIWKGSAEYGINMWNGVYYQLEIDGNKLVGKINEMDMDKLGVPPEAGNLRPIREVDLEEGDPDSHWLPYLIIE